MRILLRDAAEECICQVKSVTADQHASGRYGTGDPSGPPRAEVVPAVTVLRAARAVATATMAVTRLIRDAFCDCVSCHQVNPIPRDSVAATKAVTVPATATGCFLVCGHR